MSRSVVLALLLAFVLERANAFAPTLPFTNYNYAAAASSARVSVVPFEGSVSSSSVATALHMIDPVQNTLLLAELEPWVKPTALFLDPFLNFMSFAMVRDSDSDS
jgi:hypothetical protein